MGMDVDVDENEEDVPASVPEEIQPQTPFGNGNQRDSVDSSGHESSIPGSKRKPNSIEAGLYISPRQLREQRKKILGGHHMEPYDLSPRQLGEETKTLPGVWSQNFQRMDSRLKNSQSPRKPSVIIPVNEEREESEEPNEVAPIVSVERTLRESPPLHSKQELARRRTAQRELGIPALEQEQEQEDKELTPVLENTQEKTKHISAKDRPRRKSILERELGITVPIDEEQEEVHEEPIVSLERTPQERIHSKIARQRGLRKVASEQDGGDKEPTPVVETPPKKIKGISRKERPRKSVLERELGIVPSANEDEDTEPTPTVETPLKETRSLDRKERPRRSILERELGIVPSADEDSSDLHHENHNRRTSSVASDRIARQAEIDAAPINVFDRYLGESDVELPKPRRSSESQAYVKKEGYKKLIGVRSRYPTSEDESVFDPSEARRNATPFRDAKGQLVRKGSSSAMKPKSEDKKRGAPRSSPNIASVPSSESESPRNFSGSPVRSRPQRRLFNNKSEIPSSSAEEESGSEMMGSQQDMESTANKGNNRAPLRLRVNRVAVNHSARIPLFNASLKSLGAVDSGSMMPKSSPPVVSTNTEEQIKSPSTDLPSGMLSNTSRIRDSASMPSPVVTRLKRNKAADFFDVYDDYQPRSPPPSSDVSFQGEPESMTLCGDTQLPVEEELASMTILGVTQFPVEEELASMTILGVTQFPVEEPDSMEFPWDSRMPDLRTVLGYTQLPVEEEPESMTLRGDNTQRPVEKPSETAAAPQPYTESSIKSTVDALFHLGSSCSPPDSSDSSYHTAQSHQEDLDLSQEARPEAASPPKPAKNEKAKRQPAKSPYFKQLAESPKKKGKGKVSEIDGQEMSKTPKKESTSSPNKRSPGGFVSCIPFPPLSSPNFGLIQEKLAHDPFRLLIAVTFLNRTKGKQAIPVFYELVEKYPTPEALSSAPREDIVEIIRHLGLQNQRAETFQTYGEQWLEDPPTKDKRYIVKGYPKRDSGRDIERGEIVTGSERHTEWEIGHMTQGSYAIDSWRIFCRDVLRGVADSWNGENAKEENFQPEWMRVIPEDKELRAYLRWMWLKEGFHWDPFTGDKEVARSELMEAAMGRKGRIAWDDLGGMRIIRDEDGENGKEKEKGEEKESVDIGKKVEGELDVNMVGVDGPPVERKLKFS